MKKFYIVLPGKDVEFAVISRDVNTVVQAAEPIARKDDSEMAYVFVLVAKCEIVNGETRWDDAE